MTGYDKINHSLHLHSAGADHFQRECQPESNIMHYKTSMDVDLREREREISADSVD